MSAATAAPKKAPAKKSTKTTKSGETKARDYSPKVPKGAKYDPAKGDRAVRFFEQYLRHMKGRWAGQAFTLEPWQADEIIRPLFGTIDPKTGLRWYREALVGLARKNGKSELAAGIALYMLVADGEYGAEVYSLAGDRKQASLVYKTAGDMVRSSLFRHAVKVYRSIMEVPETGSTYRALSADADLQHGLNPHCAIVDEYHVHRDAEQYEAMRTGTAARLQPLIVTITTAGAERRGPAWELYERGRSGEDPKMFFYWRGAPAGTDITDLKAFKEANPASWVSIDFLKDQRDSLPEPVFRRLHGNEWYEGAEHEWIPRESWEQLVGDTTFDEDLPVVIGIDAASRRDTTAVCAIQRQKDGKLRSRMWLYEVDPSMGYLDYGEVESLIRELASTYNVRRVAFDPFQFVRSAQMLDAEGLPVETFPQNDARMVPASQTLYDAIMQGTLVHDGDQRVTDQVLAAGVVETVRGWRLHKRKSGRSIDACIALAIACQLAEWEEQLGDGPRVFVI